MRYYKQWNPIPIYGNKSNIYVHAWHTWNHLMTDTINPTPSTNHQKRALLFPSPSPFRHSIGWFDKTVCWLQVQDKVEPLDCDSCIDVMYIQSSCSPRVIDHITSRGGRGCCCGPARSLESRESHDVPPRFRGRCCYTRSWCSGSL